MGELTLRSTVLLGVVAAVGLGALVVAGLAVRRAVTGDDHRAMSVVTALGGLMVTGGVVGLLVAVTAQRPSGWILSTVSRLHPQFDALVDPDPLPAAFPPLTVDAGDDHQPGTVLLSTFTSPRATADQPFHPSYAIEVDKATGEVVFARRQYSATTMFQPQPGGRTSYAVYDDLGQDGAGIEVTHHVMDADHEVVASYDLADLPGGDADLHDFELLDNGNALLLAYRQREVDMTEFGGVADALVYDTVIAERTPDGETVWLWDGAEHMDLADAPDQVRAQRYGAAPPAVIDYAHPNSLDVFDDGDLLVSIRHYDCLYRIDRPSGEIEWTFGGRNCRNNEFEISGDPHDGFSHQHDATVLDDGNILLFDNANLRDDPVSRVVEYAIDEQARTAELVWSHDDGRYTSLMGSAERLANGNTLISWGQRSQPVITEVTPEGARAWSLSVPPGQLVYHAHQGN